MRRLVVSGLFRAGIVVASLACFLDIPSWEHRPFWWRMLNHPVALFLWRVGIDLLILCDLIDSDLFDELDARSAEW